MKKKNNDGGQHRSSFPGQDEADYQPDWRVKRYVVESSVGAAKTSHRLDVQNDFTIDARDTFNVNANVNAKVDAKVDAKGIVHAGINGNMEERSQKEAQVLQCRVVESDQFSINRLFHKMFEKKVDDLGYLGSRQSIAVEYSDETYSYAQLEKLANRIAHYLQANGVKCHDRVGLLFDRSIYSYASMLAVMKAGAAFVPLDAVFPSERIEYMLADSGVDKVLTLSRYISCFENITCRILALDAERDAIDRMPARRARLPVTLRADALCYVIYTSGSTGKPKGVPISHANISGFLGVACLCYGYRTTDRVYQALTLAFDFSVEEIWVPLLCGATLLPVPMEGSLAGDDLAEFLVSNNITALCCVPTLLATIDEVLPSLRFLMVSGEACPQALVDKWACDGRRFLNTYGPTETTVTATWKVLEPKNSVSIGGPLPGYSIVILEPEKAVALKPGVTGEIGIAGIGLSTGYLNLPEQTERVFIDDFIGIDDNPSRKIYRTGDLGLINPDNEIEYQGRIDSQVKIRGYRIELGEIESVLATVSQLSEVAVCTTQADPDSLELVAYYTVRPGAVAVTDSDIQTVLQQGLPAYMVPAYYEKLEIMPHLPSGKIDRKKLPEPAARRLLTSGKVYCAPDSELERQLADILAGILNTDRISVNDHFFDDLAANSLIMAKFVTGIRKNLSIKGISLKKIYQNSTIASLAQLAEAQLPKVATTKKTPEGSREAECSTRKPGIAQLEIDRQSAEVTSFAPLGASGVASDVVADKAGSSGHSSYSESVDSLATAGGSASLSNKNIGGRTITGEPQSVSALWCGLVQCVVFAGYIFVLTIATIATFTWINSFSSPGDLYIRSLLGANALMFGTAGLLIAVKWLAIGRFKVEEIPIWSARYVRFWIARTAVLANPFNMFRGTPVYNLFLRSVGVSVGSQAIVYARPPVCCDLVKIGSGTVIREDVFVTAYSAESGVIHTGTVEIGAGCYVGEASVLDINTRMGNSAQLGHASALLQNQVVPDQQSFHGSPAEPANTDYDRLPSLPISTLRSVTYAVMQLLAYTLVALPLTVSLLLLVSGYIVWPSAIGGDSAFVSGAVTLLASAAVIYLAGVCTALVSVLTIPRLIRPLMQEGKVHPVYGWQFYLGQSMNRFSNSRLLNWLFGDSSMILHYLRAIGYDMKDATQTGSNFGVDQRQHSPFLCKFGRNTLVSDRLRMTNMQVSKSSYKISQISVPANMYLGNALHYPVGARLAENCLIGTKTMIPVDGPVYSDTGILGSPAFSIPRSVASDHKFDHYLEPVLLKQRLKLKLKSNLVTVAIYMTKSWLQIFLLLAIAWVGVSVVKNFSETSLFWSAGVGTGVVVTNILVILLFSIFCERLAQGFKPLKPLYCSLYDRRFWLHERFWKMNSNLLLDMFSGTPMKPVFNRIRGVKIGTNMFDDGVSIVEHDLVQIGDNCTFNVNSVAQSHSLEDGTFKSDHIVIASNCDFGVGAFIHYGTAIENNTRVLADSFVMKGTVTGVNVTWGGNPACEMVSHEADSAGITDENSLVAGELCVEFGDEYITGKKEPVTG